MTLLQTRATKVMLSGVAFFVACGFADVTPSTPSTDPLGPIFVNDFSFEDQPIGGLGHSCVTPTSPDCSFSIATDDRPIPGWISTGSASGQIQPGPTPNSLFNTIPDGFRVAFSNGGTISQDVGVTVQPGVAYILNVDLGERKGQTFHSSAELLAGSTVVATATGSRPTSGDFSTFTASFTGTAADAGLQITIRLVSTGAQGAFDDVRLTAVPEPAFYGVVGIGLGGLLAFARRKRSA